MCRNKVGGEWTGQVNDWPRGRGGEEPRVTWAPSGADRWDGATSRAVTMAGKAPGWDCGHVSGGWESHTRRSLGTIKDFISPENQGPSVYIQHLWTMNSEVLRCG